MSVATLPFLAFGASQVATPGPANMALMATGARFGFRASLSFVAGVALGKQLIIWPIGFGLMSLAASAPWAFEILKYASMAYIFWLAWKGANLRLSVADAGAKAPGFFAGLWVHPLNPKAWAIHFDHRLGTLHSGGLQAHQHTNSLQYTGFSLGIITDEECPPFGNLKPQCLEASELL